MNCCDTTTPSTATASNPISRVRVEYSQLRRLAARKMAKERCDHLLTATALTNELTLRMLADGRMPTENREQFFAWAATAMGNLLIDHARAQRCRKRGGGQPVGTYDDAIQVDMSPSDDVSGLMEALAKLSRIDGRRAEVVRLKYFDGLSHQEIAERQNVSLATVKRDWEGARRWLQQELLRMNGDGQLPDSTSGGA